MIPAAFSLDFHKNSLFLIIVAVLSGARNKGLISICAGILHIHDSGAIISTREKRLLKLEIHA